MRRYASRLSSPTTDAEMFNTFEDKPKDVVGLKSSIKKSEPDAPLPVIPKLFGLNNEECCRTNE